MKLDVVFSPAVLGAHEVAGRAVFVIDVLRASTTICAALHHGARAVVPVETPDEAMRLAQSLGPEDVQLAGERACERIPGFALGNSPREMSEEAVKARTVVMTTTNGTAALLAAAGAHEICVAAAVNLAAAGARLREHLRERREVVVLCAGRESRFALEDAYAAGRLIHEAFGRRRLRKGLDDAGLVAIDLVRRYGLRWERPLMLSAAGRHLRRLGMEADVADAARENAYPVLPRFHDRRITAMPAPAVEVPS
ncbi:MAG: 2-phosphosulfolactate phosphatase [Gemmatimonadales bacterium]